MTSLKPNREILRKGARSDRTFAALTDARGRPRFYSRGDRP